MPTPTAPSPSPFDADARATWSVEDVLAWLGISRSTLDGYRNRGDFPAPRVLPGGRLVRWDRNELRAWYDALETAAA